MSSFIRRMVTLVSRLRGGAIVLTNSRYERQVDAIGRRAKEFSPLSVEALKRRGAAIERD
jgi:hypothetical protein